MRNKPSVIITGAAGFIGSALAERFIKANYKVIGIDNINDYYDINLKKSRLKRIEEVSKNINGYWEFNRISIEDIKALEGVFKGINDEIILINLAAQAGVRYSIDNPEVYMQSNLIGFGNILEISRKYNVCNLIYASSSSVYGGNTNYPYKETHPVNHPVSFYAATKKSNELMAHSYSNLYGINATGLRYFTVYGPWGRPDMAPMIFANSITKNKPINIYNNGLMRRDFTFIDDIVEATYLCALKKATINTKFDSNNPDQATSFSPHRIFNIGAGNSIELLYFIELLEKAFGTKAIKKFLPMQKGDVLNTAADINLLKNWVNYKPQIKVEDGVKKFVNWYKTYFDV